MAPRHLIAIVAVVVVGIGVYLFLQVNADPPAVSAVAPRPATPMIQAPDLHAPVARPPLPPPPPTNVPTVEAPAAARPALTPEEAEAAHAEAAADLRSRVRARPVFKTKPNPKLDLVMQEATNAYDKGDLAKAKTIASKVLARFPSNAQMLHVMVSSSCAEGNVEAAQKYYGRLSPADRASLKKQCATGTLTEPTP